MSFLKDFKEDLTQAVNELVSEDVKETEAEDLQDEDMVNTLDEPLMADLDLDAISDLMGNETSADFDEAMDDMMVNTLDDEAQEAVEEEETTEELSDDTEATEAGDDDMLSMAAELFGEESKSLSSDFDEVMEDIRAVEAENFKEEIVENDTEDVVAAMAIDDMEEVKEEMDVEEKEEVMEEQVSTFEQSKADDIFTEDVVSDEVTEITKGTSLIGNISSEGSINLAGKITGDVTCKGKLVITGSVKGVSHAGEIFANNSKIEGDVKSEGSVKVGNGSIIVGNIYATSAVIGGAVKGDIDVHGPVIVDATAVVQGNIKSRSVQINNGAAIEGYCSQCYADVDYQALFDDTFGA